MYDDRCESDSYSTNSSSSGEDDDADDDDLSSSETEQVCSFERLEAMAFSIGEDLETTHHARSANVDQEGREKKRRTFREALGMMRRASLESRHKRKNLKERVKAMEARSNALKMLERREGEEEEVVLEKDEGREEENLDVLEFTSACKRAIEKAKKQARKGNASKEKVEAIKDELEREKRVKKKAFEDAEAARVEALIPIKVSLEEEISQTRDELEAALRRIKDLHDELEKENVNASERERDASTTESSILPKCKKIYSEAMVLPERARKKMDETVETLREEKERLETLDTSELKQITTIVKGLKDTELMHTKKLNAIESEYDDSMARLCEAKIRFDQETNRKEEEKAKLRVAKQRNDGDVQLLFEEAKDTEKSVLRTRQREDGSKLKVLRKLKQTYRESELLAETNKDILCAKIRMVEDEKKENEELLIKLKHGRDFAFNETKEIRTCTETSKEKEEEISEIEKYKREEIHELELEIAESSKSAEHLRKIELKMAKNASNAKRDAEKLKDSLHFYEGEVKMKNATLLELNVAKAKARVRLHAMEKFANILETTKSNIIANVLVVFKENELEKMNSINSEAKEQKTLAALKNIERSVEEERAKLRKREKPILDEKTREVNATIRELETVTRRMHLAKTALQRDVQALETLKILASSEREEKTRYLYLKESAANELVDVEDELENALNLSDITENKSIETDALIRDREIEMQRLSNKVADVRRTKRATQTTKGERVPRLKESIRALKRTMRSEKKKFKKASKMLENPDREKRVKKLSQNIFSSFLTSSRGGGDMVAKDAYNKRGEENEGDEKMSGSSLMASLTVEVNEAVAKISETETRLVRVERRRKLLLEILHSLDAEIQSFQKADADTLFARTKLARAMHATNRGIREICRKTLATTAELGFSKASRLANERDLKALAEELEEKLIKEKDFAAAEKKNENEHKVIITPRRRKQNEENEKHDGRRINAYVPDDDPSGIGLPIPFAPFFALAPSKILIHLTNKA
jgi:hypothetical protein